MAIQRLAFRHIFEKLLDAPGVLPVLGEIGLKREPFSCAQKVGGWWGGSSRPDLFT